GSTEDSITRAITIKAEPTFLTLAEFDGHIQVSMQRITETNRTFQGSVIDEIKWRDLYTFSSTGKTEFGNVTTVNLVSKATESALALKERKFNCLITRKLPSRISGSTFTTALYETRDIADILSSVCLDPFIGNRALAEIDFDSIYDTSAEIADYFGSDKVSEFAYTFDSDNLSFEETVSMISSCAFSIAYRRGNVIKLSFEKANNNPTLLFNHRNKVPKTEVRTFSFGNNNDNDGIELEYTNPDDDTLVTYYLPTDQSAVNPRKVEIIGIRSQLQAHFHANRYYNKLRYQNTTLEFEGTQETNLLILQDKIVVTDGTRSGVQDGEILAVNGLEVTLSQAVTLNSGTNYLFLQHVDGTLEAIAVATGSTNRKLVLAAAPRLPLAVDYDLYARCVFNLVGTSPGRASEFLVVEKNIRSPFSATIKSINYDTRYYQNDLDLINNVVNENGVIL
ncbi:MAG: host specificity factor TipJ family phage tail protein, partial [Candidatus Aenigmarchaeota archaeon]|nr:host specificity factor TipJ family phage tail protein [Candidatus Aenigmarchaeota archaeon]